LQLDRPADGKRPATLFLLSIPTDFLVRKMAPVLGLPAHRLKFTPHCRSFDYVFKSSETADSRFAHLTLCIIAFTMVLNAVVAELADALA
jgi:hypothetical protein